MLERVRARRRVHSPKRTITPPYAGKHSAQPSRARLDAQETMPARKPLEMPGRYCFHSTRPAPWKPVGVAWSVERQAPVQEWSELQARETTMLQCVAVEVRKGSERSTGPSHTLPASFLAPKEVRDGRRTLCRGAAFDLPCRCCQATSSITNFLPLNEIASPARLPSNSA